MLVLFSRKSKKPQSLKIKQKKTIYISKADKKFYKRFDKYHQMIVAIKRKEI